MVEVWSRMSHLLHLYGQNNCSCGEQSYVTYSAEILRRVWKLTLRRWSSGCQGGSIDIQPMYSLAAESTWTVILLYWLQRRSWTGQLRAVLDGQHEIDPSFVCKRTCYELSWREFESTVVDVAVGRLTYCSTPQSPVPLWWCGCLARIVSWQS